MNATHAAEDPISARGQPDSLRSLTPHHRDRAAPQDDSTRIDRSPRH